MDSQAIYLKMKILDLEIIKTILTTENNKNE